MTTLAPLPTAALRALLDGMLMDTAVDATVLNGQIDALCYVLHGLGVAIQRHDWDDRQRRAFVASVAYTLEVAINA